MVLPLTQQSAKSFQRAIGRGDICIFPADTVYGLACDPDSDQAAARLNRLKGRDQGKPSAVMYFSLDLALMDFDELPDATLDVLSQLLPGPFTFIVSRAAGRFEAAARGGDTIGLRVPALQGPLEPLTDVNVPVMQTSCNVSAEPPAAELSQVPSNLLAGAELVLDAGPLPGTASTVVDLTELAEGRWKVLRERTPADLDRLNEVLPQSL